MKIGFIGCGNMATAMLKGILKSGEVAATDMIASAKSDKTRKKISLLFISVIPNWVNRKNWLSKFGRKPGMPEYGLPPTSWDTIIRRRNGLICLKQ